jgi:hypothetical protein
MTSSDAADLPRLDQARNGCSALSGELQQKEFVRDVHLWLPWHEPEQPLIFFAHFVAMSR